MECFRSAIGGRRCSNFLNESPGRTLEGNVDIVEARITRSGDGDFSLDLIQGRVLGHECVFLVVGESDLDDWLGGHDQALHLGQRAPSLFGEHDDLGVHGSWEDWG